MQFKVPQDVQIADKIVGPLTLRQLIIVFAGGGLDYMLYMSLARTWEWGIWAPPVFIIAVITISFAFIKVNNVEFYVYLLLLFEYYTVPRKRFFNRRDSLTQYSVFNQTQVKKTEDINKKKDNEAKINDINEALKYINK